MFQDFQHRGKKIYFTAMELYSFLLNFCIYLAVVFWQREVFNEIYSNEMYFKESSKDGQPLKFPHLHQGACFST